MEAIEEAFSCLIVHSQTEEKDKISTWQKQLKTLITGITQEQQEIAVKKFLYISTKINNYKQLHLVLSLLEYLVTSNTLPAK